MKSISAILLVGIMSGPVLAGDDQWLAATAAGRELANQLDYLQRALSTAPSGRGFYAQFDGISNDMVYFQQQLKRKVPRESLLLAFDKVDAKLHQLLKDLRNFEKWDAGLAMVASRVESADHDVHFALAGSPANDAGRAETLRRQTLVAQARTENLENMVRYVFDGLGMLQPWRTDLAAFKQSLNAFQQAQSKNASAQELKSQYTEMDRLWRKVVERVKNMPQGQFVIVQSDAAQVDQVLSRLAVIFTIDRPAALSDPLAF